MVVVSTETRDERHVVVAEAVDHDLTTRMFGYRSPNAIIAVGDFVSMMADLISFLHPETLTHVTFREGAAIEAIADASAATQPKTEMARRAQGSAVNKTRLIKNPARKKDYSREMTEAETIHFHGQKINVAQLCDQLGPVVKSYARAGTRKPRDVALRLRTAAGVPWTPRLAHYLLALIFSEKVGRDRKEAPLPTAPRTQPPIDRNSDPLTQDDIVSRLSALGRVTVKAK